MPCLYAITINGKKIYTGFQGRDCMICGKKFKNKYHIESTRLQSWDYGWNGAYFITTCTKNRMCYFGEIVENNMQLSNIGILADVLWAEIKNHAKNIELGEFVVMPNHVHGVLILNNRDRSDDNRNDPEKSIGQQRFQNQGKNTISSIVGGYKSAVSKHAHRLGYEFVWQSRFHDHIIRNDESFNKISEYINTNPQNWQNDKFYVSGE